ncbi:MAG: DUF3427 domain-containing protein [Acidaminococcus sp.]|nr:DUF3427 domain-containing protein [Acidaminococcus sp.]MCI2100972.1 DUF3427 domain-containing protein [Acidaminococcus sp.]MCI2115315.1 DUF3427 domain-containing protein [Acidaminococcus sp.]MCI2117383.1 DUF3427 domain-containing protein [Acidaminococcus sp.]
MNTRTLPSGIYEKIISEEFGKILDEAIQSGEISARMQTLDPQDAVNYLASYVKEIVQRCLKTIADSEKEDNNGELLTSELTLTNEVIRLLANKIKELGKGHEIKQADFLLTQLTQKMNRLKDTPLPRPETSLSRSFLFTNSQKDISLVSELRREIASSDRIDFLVSFIKFSGFSMIRPELIRFTNNGGKMRILTTTYMGATDPKAIEELANLPNTEVKISYNVKETRLHAKSYIFHRESHFSTAYIGSSNLSHAAIADGLEWNMKITERDMPDIMKKMDATFESYWNSAEFKLFDANKDADELQQAIDAERHPGERKSAASYTFEIRPYPYQQIILDALQVERKERHHYHNLIVAATGTGKTAIAAFDYRRFTRSRKKGARLLFVAHREEILEQALSCFRQVMRDPNFGKLYVGRNKTDELSHLFMSIQSLESTRLWEHMTPDYYDMIIVDEFHHAAAKSYQNLLSYFKPKILLGLTATPERMDGKNILSYFDGHIAAEIRLSDAIERRLLCPFHYFGVADTVDLTHIKWTNGQYDLSELNHLFALDSAPAMKRARAIRAAVDRYTADNRDIKGLGFCVSIDHAHFMARYFNDHDLPSAALTGKDSDETRKQARTDLETGKIKFLFVVDLFNEGIDIPSINTVLFLRPTNSLTIFLQQLGRGLRLAPHKDCLTVLDFVAQANRKYNFAARFEALLGGRQNGKIKKEIEHGFPHVPKGCSIQLEEIAQKRVLDNIKARLRRNDYYKELIQELYEAAGRVPTIMEFMKAAGIDLNVFYDKTRSFTRLCMEAGVLPSVPPDDTEEKLTKAFPRILSIDSPKWLTFLMKSFDTPPSSLSDVEKQYARMWQFTLLGSDGEGFGETLARFPSDSPFTKELKEVLSIQYDSFSVLPEMANLPYPCALEVYCHYSRDQIFAALGVDKPSSVREGVKYLDPGKSNTVTKPTDVFLVTLNKSEKEFSDTTLYEDYSMSETLFHWQSQNLTTPASTTGQRYIHQRENGNIVLFFVRERKKGLHDVAMSFTFLGKAQIVSWSGSQPMTIIYKLEHPIPAKYIRTTDSAGVM